MVFCLNQSINSQRHVYFFSDMSYEPGGACETASTDGEHHQYINHYNSSTRSQQPSRPYSNGFHDSLTQNNHNRLDHIETEKQQIDNDYEEMAPDRPKLLMWGLTKYRNRNNYYLIHYLLNILEVVKRRLLSLFLKK